MYHVHTTSTHTQDVFLLPNAVRGGRERKGEEREGGNEGGREGGREREREMD